MFISYIKFTLENQNRHQTAENQKSRAVTRKTEKSECKTYEGRTMAGIQSKKADMVYWLYSPIKYVIRVIPRISIINPMV